MALGCLFAVSEANIPKMLPPPSACWVIRFSQPQQGQMIQRFAWRGDPGQTAVGSWVWRRSTFVLGPVVAQLGEACAHGAGDLHLLQLGSFSRQPPSSGCPAGEDFLGSRSESGIQSSSWSSICCS